MSLWNVVSKWKVVGLGSRIVDVTEASRSFLIRMYEEVQVELEIK